MKGGKLYKDTSTKKFINIFNFGAWKLSFHALFLLSIRRLLIEP